MSEGQIEAELFLGCSLDIRLRTKLKQAPELLQAKCDYTWRMYTQSNMSNMLNHVGSTTYRINIKDCKDCKISWRIH